MKHALLHAVLFPLFLIAPFAHAEEFRIEFDWPEDMAVCFAKQSPEIRLFNVPEGTKKLTVTMIDEDNPYRHGGGKMKYSGESAIPAGTLKNWEGPCPPSPHTYTFIVKTKGGNKAKARYSQKYPK